MTFFGVSIKPSNIFLDLGKAVIGDFGFARRLEIGELAGSELGTKNYKAPEILLGLPYNYSADIYRYFSCLLSDNSSKLNKN